ncbi:hypothetical protein PoB_004571100 [Plakobranchus ocellatus]|uniref:Uncharacterized protein n=1 Tax=Plakobranchus ocellatus TaxID=259542 RepID=A0AAV4BFK6_9GAST|nr:hypothetical protein PoB_004571100 [Plakobranchus ocellatus]
MSLRRTSRDRYTTVPLIGLHQPQNRQGGVGRGRVASPPLFSPHSYRVPCSGLPASRLRQTCSCLYFAQKLTEASPDLAEYYPVSLLYQCLRFAQNLAEASPGLAEYYPVSQLYLCHSLAHTLTEASPSLAEYYHQSSCSICVTALPRN